MDVAGMGSGRPTGLFYTERVRLDVAAASVCVFDTIHFARPSAEHVNTTGADCRALRTSRLVFLE